MVGFFFFRFLSIETQILVPIRNEWSNRAECEVVDSHFEGPSAEEGVVSGGRVRSSKFESGVKLFVDRVRQQHPNSLQSI
jgi:hypothetical protein